MVSDEDVDRLVQDLTREAEARGYRLNPDREFARALVRGLLSNRERYGYISCPCRLASGNREDDLDIICPCDYRDPDLNDYGACYCALYVSGDVVAGKSTAGPIPERRPSRAERKEARLKGAREALGTLAYPVWRCRVCGYLCAMNNPPLVCPICKAKQDRFERFL